MRRCIVSTLVGMLTSLISCSFVPGAPTPEAATQQDVVTGQDGIQDFQVAGTRMWEDGVIVLYTYLLRTPGDDQALPVTGYSYTGRQLLRWKVRSGQSFGGMPLPPLIAYKTGQVNDATIVFGKVLSADVIAVEATFETGTVVRDEADDKVFALLAPHSRRFTEVRVIGKDQKILQRYDQPELINQHEIAK